MEERPNPNRIYPEEPIGLLVQRRWWDFAGDDLAEFLPVLCEPDWEKAPAERRIASWPAGDKRKALERPLPCAAGAFFYDLERGDALYPASITQKAKNIQKNRWQGLTTGRGWFTIIYCIIICNSAFPCLYE